MTAIIIVPVEYQFAIVTLHYMKPVLYPSIILKDCFDDFGD